MRLAMLLSLCSGKRGQNLHLLDLNYLVYRGNVRHFDIRVPVKNYGSAGDITLQSVISFYEYPYDERLCPVKTLDRYIKVTRQLRMSPRLFLISIKPHTRASRATISRWIKNVMELSGIDITVYKPHSLVCREFKTPLSLKFPNVFIQNLTSLQTTTTFHKECLSF